MFAICIYARMNSEGSNYFGLTVTVNSLRRRRVSKNTDWDTKTIILWMWRGEDYEWRRFGPFSICYPCINMKILRKTNNNVRRAINLTEVMFHLVRSEVPTSKMFVFCVLTPCGHVGRYQLLGGIFFLPLRCDIWFSNLLLTLVDIYIDGLFRNGLSCGSWIVLGITPVPDFLCLVEYCRWIGL